MDNTVVAVTLTPAEIERLELETRGNLITATTTLRALREGGAHRAADMTWPAYVLDRFGDVLRDLRIATEDRRALAHHMRGSVRERRPGESLARIADRLGVSKSQVRNDVRATDTGDYPAKTAGTDGRVKPAVGAPRGEAFVPTGRVFRTDRLVALVEASGPTGRTALSLEEETGWRHGSVSAALHRLADPRAHRLGYLPPVKRGQHGRYVGRQYAG